MRTEHPSACPEGGGGGGGRRTEIEVVRPPGGGCVDLHGAGLHGVAHEDGLVHVLREYATLRRRNAPETLTSEQAGDHVIDRNLAVLCLLSAVAETAVHSLHAVRSW